MLISCRNNSDSRILYPYNLLRTLWREEWGTVFPANAARSAVGVIDYLGHSTSTGNRPPARIDAAKSGGVCIQ